MNARIARFLINTGEEDLIELLMETLVEAQNIEVLEKIERAVATVRAGYEDIAEDF